MKKDLLITNETGLHARPASTFVNAAGKYESDVEIIFGEKTVNAKSIMGLMSLGISQDSKITIKTKGEDEEEALKGLVSFVEENINKEH
ncbi:phosphocarrier protein [Halanaerobium saccharolyticum]|uniref:Phosphocarrier protein HPr n=1 Tax=Halanaerobium saccharolyticum TaxID=43595 RepID=A0A4R6LRI5_9FIRM|nr:HPr family phosphocarrier protein [Halanaerobium saccharolyticum]TDO90071.1 phosphocarrier protein [Halanaerobium saccharolyticum]